MIQKLILGLNQNSKLLSTPKSYFLRSEKKVGSYYSMLKMIYFSHFLFSGKLHCYIWPHYLTFSKAEMWSEQAFKYWNDDD